MSTSHERSAATCPRALANHPPTAAQSIGLFTIYFPDPRLVSVVDSAVNALGVRASPTESARSR